MQVDNQELIFFYCNCNRLGSNAIKPEQKNTHILRYFRLGNDRSIKQYITKSINPKWCFRIASTISSSLKIRLIKKLNDI